MATVLIVEDEKSLAELLRDYLLADGFSCLLAHDGNSASSIITNSELDIILLDLMLPGKDGLTLCREIRKNSDTPIIMTTAKVEEIDRLIGLEIGADDYVCKPYSPRELVARTKAVLRRFNPAQHRDAKILLDLERMSVTIGGENILLTAVEMRLFELLFSNPGKIFSRQFIMDNIYTDYRIVSDRTVDSHVKKLRKKLHEAAPALELIHSIYGVGYKFEYRYA